MDRAVTAVDCLASAPPSPSAAPPDDATVEAANSRRARRCQVERLRAVGDRDGGDRAVAEVARAGSRSLLAGLDIGELVESPGQRASRVGDTSRGSARWAAVSERFRTQMLAQARRIYGFDAPFARILLEKSKGSGLKFFQRAI